MKILITPQVNFDRYRIVVTVDGEVVHTESVTPGAITKRRVVVFEEWCARATFDDEVRALPVPPIPTNRTPEESELERHRRAVEAEFQKRVPSAKNVRFYFGGEGE